MVKRHWPSLGFPPRLYSYPAQLPFSKDNMEHTCPEAESHGSGVRIESTGCMVLDVRAFENYGSPQGVSISLFGAFFSGTDAKLFSIS